MPLIHVSTDYVFDGLKGAPYVETDPTTPTGVYGASKLAGEQAVLAACPQAIILRTSWVYAADRQAISCCTMLNAGARNPKLRVVADQNGCPTAAAGPGRGDPAHRRPASRAGLGRAFRRHPPCRRRGLDELARPRHRGL